MLLDSPILQVAVGLFFTYTLLSLIATQVNTLILNFFNLRAKQLKEGLINLVTDKDLQAKILGHPLIRMVEQQVNPTQALTPDEQNAIITAKPTKVTYIPAETFVKSLIGVLTAESDYSIFQPLDDAINLMDNNDEKLKMRELYRDLRSFGTTDTKAFREAILQLQNENVRQVLSYALEQVEDGLGRLTVKSGPLIPLLDGIRQVKDPHFQGAIETIVASAVSLEDAQGKIQAWFDDGMGRIGDVYKRKLQWISLAIGLGMALVLNADTVQIARALINDQNLRTSIAAAAQTSSTSLQSQVTGTTDAQANAVQGGTTAQADQGNDASTVQETYKQLASLSLPIGWAFTPVDATQAQAQVDAGLPDPYQDAQNVWNALPLGNPNWFWNLVAKLIGWVLTAIAVAQGAPFWFDLLRRLTGGGGGSQGGTTTVSAPVNVTTPPVTVNVGSGYTNGDGGTAAKPAEPAPQLETWPIPSEMPPVETSAPAGTGDEEGAVG